MGIVLAAFYGVLIGAMSGDTRLLTLVHVSDLHIGQLDASGDNPLDSDSVEWWKHFRPFDGYLGHTHVALKQLVSLVDMLQGTEGPEVYVVVTGDLTTNGGTVELQNAEQYLRGQLGTGVGLELQSHEYAAIAGNHDHWPGSACHWHRAVTCMLGGPNAALSTFIPPMGGPVTISLAGGYRLRLEGIDSEADVPPISAERVCAIGQCVSECNALDGRLPARSAGEIRVLLMHHSTIEDGPAGRSSLDATSRGIVGGIVLKHGFSMVLTGHKHRHAFRHPAENGGIREARCGSSTSRDYFDRSLPVVGSWRARLARNEVLVHRLWERSSHVEWDTEVWRRRIDLGGHFEAVGSFLFGRV